MAGKRTKEKKTLDKKIKRRKKKMAPLTCHILRGEDTAEGSARRLLLHWTDLSRSVEGAIGRTEADHVTNSEARRGSPPSPLPRPRPRDWISFGYRANHPIAS